MKYAFSHLRPLNLLMLALTQGVCGWYMVREGAGIPFTSLALLIFSTVCITAAGYLINDYYDRAIDARNKPQKALPNTPEAKKVALLLYVGLNVLGFLAAIPPTLAAERPFLLSIQIGTIALLWVYSKWWKRLPVIGNVTVAALTTLSIWMLYLYVGNVDFLSYSFLVLPIFAFVLTWVREMVKDIEDLEGDRAEGCKTLPIVCGIKAVVVIVFVLALGVIGSLAFWASVALLVGAIYAAQFVFLIAALLLAWAVYLLKAKTSKDFGRLSNALKLIMLGGLVCLLLI